ncbi:MAG: DNA polymerase III subunit beta [Spirochaetota bacterium]|nr:DNA polymerase III subunit beta [Spirochaetota bacterium]
MKIEVEKDSLVQSINIADSIISPKNINVILSNCLFNIIKDEIEIVSTDNDIGIRTRLQASSDSEDSFIANGSMLSGIIKELPKGLVELDIDDSYLIKIKTKSKEINANSKLIGASAENFPEIPIFYEDNAFEIDQSVMKEMIKKVIYASATDQLSPVLNGIQITSDSLNSITMVGTDSRRLAIITKDVDNELSTESDIIIPLKAANELYRILGSKGKCKFVYKNNQYFFKVDETEIISRVVDGQFPNWKQVVPVEYKINVSIETDRLLNSIKRAIFFTKEPAYKIYMNFNKNSLIIEARASDLGEFIEEIPIESNSDEEISLGINAQFVMDSIKEIDSSITSLGVTGEMSPVTFTPDNDKNYMSIIMPLHKK